MDEACPETVAVPAGTTACSDAQPHAEPYRKVFRRAAACGACGRQAVLALVSYVFVHTVPFTSYEPRHVAFLAGAHAVLASLVICLRRRCAARRLIKPKPDSSRVWVVKTAEDAAVDLLFWVFGFRVAEMGPPALTELVWCAMAIVTCAFVYVVYRDNDLLHQYQPFGEVGCDDAGHDSKAVEKVESNDQMV